MEAEFGSEKTFVRTFLPWLVAAGALAVYLLTLNRWVSLSSLLQVARVSGWTWQPELSGPLFWLVTYPFRWLPARAIPLALNLFAALCAALSLALLARSVALLPHDRTHQQRQRLTSGTGLLSLPSAWLPPVLAVIVCGLQLTFWEDATAISSPPAPWGSGCEMLDLLLFAYVIRCLLEFRLEERESWLLRASLVFGLGITNNWAMIGFLPAFLMAVVWIKGLSFFNLGFLGRMSLCGLAGLSLYLLLPLLHGGTDTSSLSFWPSLKANFTAQKGVLMTFYQVGRHEVALLALTSLLPVFIIGIRWSSYFGDTSRLGVALATFMFHVVHALFLIACIWVAFDPPFSPRNKGFGAPFLTFYYLGALSVGYCSGYFLLLFSSAKPSRRRLPPQFPVVNHTITAALWLLLVLVPVGLILRNLPQIRLTNGPMLKRYAALLAQTLPPEHTVLLSDDPRRSWLLQAYTAQSGRSRDDLFLDTTSLSWPAYHRFLKERYPQRWESNPPKTIVRQADPFLLAHLISRLALTNSVYYLHPSFGYYFEIFYPEPHGLVYKLVRYPTNRLIAPMLTKDVVDENEKFWAEADKQALQPLLAVVAPAPSGKAPSLMDRLAEEAHLAKESNNDAATLARFYSRALDYWGVELQDLGRLTNAAGCFASALALNPDNPVAQINLECNKNLQAGRKSSVQLSKSIDDQFGKYRKWDDLVGENGPFDEPNFCFEEGRTFVGGNLYRQAAEQFNRVINLAPDNIAARVWLSQLYVVSRMPDQALKLIEPTHSQPDLLDAAQTNRAELLFVEASAHLAQSDLKGAEASVRAALKRSPGDRILLTTATQVYMKYGRYFGDLIDAKGGADSPTEAQMKQGCYSNAIVALDQELALAPTNVTALVNKGYACIQNGAFEQAIPPLTKAFSLQSTNYSALLNRAIAYLRSDKLEAAQQDYEVLQKAFPTAFQIQLRPG